MDEHSTVIMIHSKNFIPYDSNDIDKLIIGPLQTGPEKHVDGPNRSGGIRLIPNCSSLRKIAC